MIHVPAPDPFTVFGLPRALDLDERALEQRYLRLSRECHPDRLRATDAGDCIAVLQRAAEINDAWQVLRDPWRRARALLEAERPGVLERNKRLDPGFLASALDLAEAVADARGAATAPLRAQLTAALAADWDRLRGHVLRGELDAAARAVHESHYHTKALHDLDAKS
ncbi:MAG: Fe-S protein assembly co-chaperone HscB [Planctomycetes bacterium]|nr:Fe-S protein assembly co-chaperone HscB [Planctomycetota bacterium]